MEGIQWWAYLHSEGNVVVKRYFGDRREYIDDYEGNEFVQQVVKPFEAPDQDAAIAVARRALGMEGQSDG